MKDMLAVLRHEGRHYVACLYKCGTFCFGFATTILAFFDLGGYGDFEVSARITLLLVIAAAAAIAAVFLTLFSRRYVLWESGESRSVATCYGDLFSLASKELGAMCVIPVNTTFDTLVDAPGDCDKPLVSPNTLHGKWVRRMLASGCSLEALDRMIAEALKGKQPTHLLDRSKKPRGKLDAYPVGTVARVSYGGTNYLLVALSEFDEDNVAHSERASLNLCLESVLSSHDRSGQGYGLYVPLMGTGMSRMGGMDKESCLIETEAFFRTRVERIQGNVNIVVWEGDRKSVSIWG